MSNYLDTDIQAAIEASRLSAQSDRAARRAARKAELEAMCIELTGWYPHMDLQDIASAVLATKGDRAKAIELMGPPSANPNEPLDEQEEEVPLNSTTAAVISNAAAEEAGVSDRRAELFPESLISSIIEVTPPGTSRTAILEALTVTNGDKDEAVLKLLAEAPPSPPRSSSTSTTIKTTTTTTTAAPAITDIATDLRAVDVEELSSDNAEGSNSSAGEDDEDNTALLSELSILMDSVLRQRSEAQAYRSPLPLRELALASIASQWEDRFCAEATSKLPLVLQEAVVVYARSVGIVEASDEMPVEPPMELQELESAFVAIYNTRTRTEKPAKTTTTTTVADSDDDWSDLGESGSGSDSGSEGEFEVVYRAGDIDPDVLSEALTPLTEAQAHSLAQEAAITNPNTSSEGEGEAPQDPAETIASIQDLLASRLATATALDDELARQLQIMEEEEASMHAIIQMQMEEDNAKFNEYGGQTIGQTDEQLAQSLSAQLNAGIQMSGKYTAEQRAAVTAVPARDIFSEPVDWMGTHDPTQGVRFVAGGKDVVDATQRSLASRRWEAQEGRRAARAAKLEKRRTRYVPTNAKWDINIPRSYAASSVPAVTYAYTKGRVPTKYVPYLHLLRLLPQNYHVRSIQNVMNPDLAKRFDKKLKELGGRVQVAYHGTNWKYMASIVHKGLVLPGSQSSPGYISGNKGFYGDGIYAAPSAWTAMGYGAHWQTGKGKLLVCATAPGRTYDCPGLMLGAKCKEGFDSHMSPDRRELVFFDPAQVLPCYVINYEYVTPVGPSTAPAPIPKRENRRARLAQAAGDPQERRRRRLAKKYGGKKFTQPKTH